MIDGGMTSWWLIRPGVYVRDKAGGTWRVDGRLDNGEGAIEFRLANRDGQVADIRVDHDGPVMVLIPTILEAEALIAARLPVADIQRRVIRMEEIEAFPDNVYHRRHVATHLLEHHGVSISVTADVQNDDIAGLLEMHALCHAEPWRIPVPHVHVPLSQL